MQARSLKKIATLLGTLLILAQTSAAQAQSAEGYLKIIAANTTQIARYVNEKLSVTMTKFDKYLMSWLGDDQAQKTATKTTADMQANFADFGSSLQTVSNVQNTTAQTVLNAALLNNTSDTTIMLNTMGTAPSSSIANEKSLRYANDLVYTSLLDKPFFPNDPRKNAQFALNYIRNASALNMYHPIPGGPGTAWNGSDEGFKRYQNYFNVVMSVESFNAWVLSDHYAQYLQEKNDQAKAAKDGKKYTPLRDRLLKQATDSDWFLKVTTEPLTFIMRQMLMYQSQLFVLQMEAIRYQKQMATAQVMTNSLLIANNLMNENVLIASARGTQPTQ